MKRSYPEPRAVSDVCPVIKGWALDDQCAHSQKQKQTSDHLTAQSTTHTSHASASWCINEWINTDRLEKKGIRRWFALCGRTAINFVETSGRHFSMPVIQLSTEDENNRTRWSCHVPCTGDKKSPFYGSGLSLGKYRCGNYLYSTTNNVSITTITFEAWLGCLFTLALLGGNNMKRLKQKQNTEHITPFLSPNEVPGWHERCWHDLISLVWQCLWPSSLSQCMSGDERPLLQRRPVTCSGKFDWWLKLLHQPQKSWK